MATKGKPLDRLELTCRELDRYNKKHGTKYSYGQYTALVRQRKIRPHRGPEWWGSDK